MRAAIRLKHMSRRTEQSYAYYAKQFILFHNKRHPKELGAEEIRGFLTHLAVEKNVAASTQNVALAALLFLYREVLRVDMPDLGDIPRARRSKHLPVVFTRQEIKAILAELAKISPTYHLIASLLYGTGMRLLECLSLRVKHIDFFDLHPRDEPRPQGRAQPIGLGARRERSPRRNRRAAPPESYRRYRATG